MSVEMDRWLSMQNPSIAKSIAVVPVSKPLLHLSACCDIRRFTPRIPASLYDGEDQNVPRVCVSANIVDTIIGAGWNFVEFNESFQVDKTNFVIYGLETDFAIRPTKKLTQEGVATGEYWVVPHRMSMFNITPLRVAKMSIKRMVYSGTDVLFDFVLDVSRDTELTATKSLSAGYYSLNGISMNQIKSKNRNLTYQLEKISRDGYLEGKESIQVLK